MKAGEFSKMLASINQATRCHIPNDNIHYSQCNEQLKSHTNKPHFKNI